MEIWKIIKNFPDYQISNYGKVKSLKYNKEKILKLSKNKDDYLYVGLSKNGKRCFKKVHRLVLETFNPIEDMDRLEVNHKKGIKSDNRLSELEWMTPSENVKHAFKIGLQNNKGKNNPMFGKIMSEKTRNKQSEKKKGKYLGENNPSSVLTKNDIVKIRIYLKERKLTQRQIAKKFNVSQSTISDINIGKKWSHV